MRSMSGVLRSLVNFDDDISVEARTFGCLWIWSCSFMAVVFISTLTNGIFKSRWRCIFLINLGAFAMTRMFEFDAVPHNCIIYVRPCGLNDAVVKQKFVL